MSSGIHCTFRTSNVPLNLLFIPSMEHTSPSKIHIIINNLYTGGAERQVINDISTFIEKGYEVHLTTLRPEKDATLIHELPSSVTHTCIHFKSIFDVHAWMLFIKNMKKIHAPVIMSHLWFANTVTRIASFFNSKKCILTFEQNVYSNAADRSWKHFVIDFLLQFRSTYIIAVSEGVKQSLLSKKIRSEKIVVIYNSVNIEKFAQNSHDAIKTFRDSIGVSDIFLCTCIGRLVPQKNIPLLIDAIAEIPDIHLALIGTGPLEEELKKYADRMNASRRIHFLGARHDIPTILQASDCFVLPSLYEGFGIVVAEALASGTPVILNNFSVAPELITDGKEGYIINTKDALIEKILYLKNNPDIRNTMSQSATKRSKAFSTETHFASIEQLFKQT